MSTDDLYQIRATLGLLENLPLKLPSVSKFNLSNDYMYNENIHKKKYHLLTHCQKIITISNFIQSTLSCIKNNIIKAFGINQESL